MKSVLISIRPKWVEKIARGEKTIEVRKTAPKEFQFKAYIYCTYGNPKENYALGKRGKVIGEFICDKVYERQIERMTLMYYSVNMGDDDREYKQIKTCLTPEEEWKYGNGKPLYGWHISDLKIYDKPKELSEYWGRIKCLSEHTVECWNCFAKCVERNGSHYKPLKRPPQSWQYVEKL